MRADMSKILVERPRYFYWNAREYGRNDEVWRMRRAGLPLEYGEDEQGRWMDLAAHIPGVVKRGMRQRTYGQRYARKEFGENLMPLLRFLRSCIGRPWDNVYSEIRARIPKQGTVNTHVYTHLFEFVARDVLFREDGSAWALVGVGARPNWIDVTRRQGPASGVWVHPETGLLHAVGTRASRSGTRASRICS